MTSRHIVITGVTQGLGRALAARLLAMGHEISGCGRSASAGVELDDYQAARFGFAMVDVSDAVQVENWARQVLTKRVAPDLLINNAGLINANAPLWEVPAEEFARLMGVNITGAFNVIRAFLPAMIERGSGVVANISSGWGRSTAPAVAPYCASKWAIEGLAQALAQELPRGLAAVAVNPGIIDTEMLRSCFGDDAASYERPETWAERAAPFFLGLGASDNGRSLSVG